MTARTLAVLCALLLLPVPVTAGDAPHAKGKYKEWGGRVDSVEIVRTFDAKYSTVYVAPFQTSSAQMPPKNENTYAAAKQVLGNVSTPFIEGLSNELKGKSVERGKVAKKGSLVVRGKVEMIDPGSRSARYWGGGFGKGAARVRISGDVVDAQGRVLFRFTQEHRAKMGIGGGGYEAMLNRCIRSVGRDVAFILNELS